MAAVFDFVFELFGRLYGEESRDTPLDFRKGNLSHYFVSTARQNGRRSKTSPKAINLHRRTKYNTR